ncbi:MAG: response regulator, partial [SAR324 cluster bacterium]|nr:response regulator [SAR324 cluster bacterium]
MHPDLKIGELKILCVDDEVAILRALRREFLELPNPVTFISDDAEAFTLVGKEEFALVISDYLMPNHLGPDIFEELTKHFPKTRKLLLTGRSDHNGKSRSEYDHLYHSYLEKPWKKRELITMIQG